MSVDHREIRLAVRAVMITTLSISQTLIAFENRPFTKPEGASVYYRETLLPSTENQTANDQVTSQGYAQIDVIGVLSAGSTAVEVAAQALKAAFKPGLSLNTSTLVVRSEVGVGRQVDQDYSIPVRIYWRAIAPIP